MRRLQATASSPLQMTYAVCSLTYAAFRRALGRDISWACDAPEGGGRTRLIVRPFGMRQRNAGYSREGGDLCVRVLPRGRQKPAGFTVSKGLIFTALSHDVIAHETTHALLDGLRSSFAVPTNPDVLAFHEGFADLVALFLHFSYPGVVEQAIRESRGAIARGSLLSDVAREFGYARSRNGGGTALRSAIDVDGVVAFDSDVPPGQDAGPADYDPDVGAASAGFRAGVGGVRGLRHRRAAQGRAAAAHRRPGSTRRWARRSSATSWCGRWRRRPATSPARFLDICIRAIDYCPPVDIEMGEYLRALVTADAELVHDDKWGYREALMRSFRRRADLPGPRGVHDRGRRALAAARHHRCASPGLAFARPAVLDRPWPPGRRHRADAARRRRSAPSSREPDARARTSTCSCRGGRCRKA